MRRRRPDLRCNLHRGPHGLARLHRGRLRQYTLAFLALRLGCGADRRTGLRRRRSHLRGSLHGCPHGLAGLHGGRLWQYARAFLALRLGSALNLPVRPGPLLITAAPVACVTDARHVTPGRIAARALLPWGLYRLADWIWRHETTLFTRLTISQCRVRQGRDNAGCAGKRVRSAPAARAARPALAAITAATPVTPGGIIAPAMIIVAAVSAIASVAAIVPVTTDGADR